MIKGAFCRSSVGTLAERKTRFLILSKMGGNGAEAALEGFTRQMKHLPQKLCKSMTYDRGLEMACHPELARRLKIDIWFCDPHARWQRGSNENTNGLLRQVLPKGSDLSQYSQRDLSHIVKLMNERPRKTLGWKTPAEAIAEELAPFTQSVAVDPCIRPFSEAHFKTLKYQPEFPKRFQTIDEARTFCRRFFAWYNEEHHHAGIGLMTPDQLHFGKTGTIQAVRQTAPDAAFLSTPERFVRQRPKPPQIPTAVWINPPENTQTTQA